MQLREALRTALSTLQEADVPSASLAAELLLMHVLGRDRTYLYTHPAIEIPAEFATRYFHLVAERCTGKPTQYITGHQEFWGLDIEVTPDVLIPRPETEHLVEAVLSLAQASAGDGKRGLASEWRTGVACESADRARLRIADAGTGSGCIALALASELSWAMIIATDISRPALVVASRNARRLGLAGRVRFVESDLLACVDGVAGGGAFDFVVSNPPYVGEDEIECVQREVRDFEPRLAWSGSGEGAEIYDRLFAEAARLLRPGGHVVVEVGYNQSDRVIRKLGPGWATAEVRPDLAGIPRVVVGRKAALSHQLSAETKVPPKAPVQGLSAES